MAIFYLCGFLVDLALGCVLLALPLLAITKFNASPLTLGLLGALGAGMYSLSVLFVGHLADALNRKKLIILGCLLFGLVYSLMPAVTSLNQIFILVPFSSISMSLFWPTIQSWMAQGLDKKRLIRAIGYFNIFWSLGLMLGPFIAGFLFEKNYVYPFRFGASVALLTACLISWQKIKRVPVKSLAADNGQSEERVSQADTFLKVAWLANFTSFFIIGIIRNIFPKLALSLSIEPSALGTLLLCLGLAQTLIFLLLKKITFWHKVIWPVFFSQAISLLGLFLIFIGQTFSIFALAFIIIGMTSGITYFVSLFFSLYEQRKKAGLHEAFLAMGVFCGPILGGFFAQQFNLKTPYLAAVGVILIAMAVEIYILKNKK